MIVANAGVGQITGSEGRPRGSVGTLKHLLNMGAGSDQEIKLSLERTEQIIAGLLSSLNADQKALLTMSEEELQNVMVHLDAEIFGKLRDDPQLRQEKADDEVRLFLRSQILMDYWLGVQNWVDLLRPRANSELRKFAQQFR
jgi:hypothetical protein